MTRGAEIVRLARRHVGTRFRAQGRRRDGGLDCVGLAAAAVGADGVPCDYALRGGAYSRIETGLRAAGLRPAEAREAGDVLVMQAGPEQIHLGIWTGAGLVHADAALRRVVERPGEPPWPVLGAWRMEG